MHVIMLYSICPQVWLGLLQMFHDYLVWSLDNYDPVGEADQSGLDGVSVAVPHVSSFS